jgi:hypothetical protein
MAIDGNVFSSKQFELYIADQETMGTANTTDAEYMQLDVVSVSDIDFGGGLVQERTLRSGQQVKQSTDHYVSQKGASATVSFEWVVSHKEGLSQLMKMVSEDTASAYEWAGTKTPATYKHGATTGEMATVIISNPNTGDDRVLHSAVLTELNLSMDSGSEGGRLVASGTFYSGYNPTVSSNAVTPAMSTTAYVKTIYDCTTKTVGASDVVAKSVNFNFAFPATRVGFQGSNAEAEQYGRSGEYVFSGSASVKYDANTDQELADFLNGTPNALVFGDGSTVQFTCGAVVYTGFTVDLGDSEEGVFVEIPWEGTANGSANLYSIIVA